MLANLVRDCGFGLGEAFEKNAYIVTYLTSALG